MAKKNLPLSDKDFYDGSGNPLKDVAKSIEILKKLIEDTTKSLIDFNTAKLAALRANPKDSSKDYQDMSKGINEVTKNNEALIQVLKEKEKLKIAEKKLQLEENQANERAKIYLQNQKKAVKELAKEQLGLIGAYQKLTKQTNDAQKKFKDLAAQFGANSKQAKAAKAEFDKLDSTLRKINEGAKDGKRDVGRYKDEIKEALAEQDVFGTSFNKIKGLFTSTTGIITGVVAGIAALGKAYTSSARGAEDLARAQDRLSSIGKQVGNSIADLTGDAGFLDAFVRSFQEQLFGIGSTIQSDIEGSIKATIRQLGILEIDQERQKKKQLDDAEKLRQIRDDERKSIDERIKANEDLGKVISEREEATIKFQNERLKNFKVLLSLDEGNIEVQKQIKQIEFEIADAREEAQGFRSEQLKNEETLLKENYANELELKKLQIENQLIFVAKGTDQELKLRKNLIDLTKELEVKAAGENEALRKIAIQNAINNTNLLFEEYRKQKALEKKQIEDIDRFLKDEFAKQTDEIKISPFELSNEEIEKQRNEDFEKQKKANDDRNKALEDLDKQHYDNIFSIFFNYRTKKKALDDNMSADEIAKLKEENKQKEQAVSELVSTLVSIYDNLLQTRIDQLQEEIDATNQKINEQEQALDRELQRQEQGAANNVQIEKEKLAKLKAERDKDLREKKKAQKEQENINKLQQASALITAIANIINQYADQGPTGWILGLLAAAAAVAGFVTYSGEASSAVGEDGFVLTKKGSQLEGGKRHSQGGNKYSSAEFQQGEMHSILNRDATQKYGDDMGMITDLMNDNKWSLYKSTLSNNVPGVVLNNDFSEMLNEQRKTNQILKGQLNPVFDKSGKLLYFNINGIKVKSEE
jgi:hypothetical protein